MRHLAGRIGWTAAVCGLLAVAGCSLTEKPRRLPGGFRLVQKGQFQALYGPDGRIVRLLQDRDRDGRADAVILYRPSGPPERGELDTDEDGAIDRWEHFRPDGALERVDTDTNRDGQPDRSDYPG
jgi:hypothetical protein